MKYLKIFMPLVLVIAAGILTITFAQTNKDGRPGRDGGERGFGRPPGPPPMGGLNPGLLRQLNLTDQQKEQIKTLMENNRTASQANFDKMKTFQDQLKAATETGTFNEDQVRQILTARSQVSIELEVNRLRTDSAIINLLTPEQKTQLQQLKQNAPDFGGRDGQRPPPPPQN